ncbi:MAG: protein translocase subunit SecF [Patescibacteria group bacterium]
MATRNLHVIKNRWIFLGLSSAVILISIISVGVFGFRQGIDFTGGSLWQFKVQDSSDLVKIESVLKEDLSISDVHLTYIGSDQSILARLPVIDQPTHDKGLTLLKSALPGFVELSFQSIGPSVGAELKKNAMLAVVFVLLGISLYIAFAFRKVSRPISSWKYGVVTLVTLFHDVIVPAGLLAFLGYSQGVEIDSNFIVALLVIAGFSVHDTIVVFDRIRENLILNRGKSDFAEIINDSVNQTMVRSVYTSLTLIFVLITLLFLGPATLHYFIATLLIGTIIGIYSSVFVASPLLLVWHRWSHR